MIIYCYYGLKGVLEAWADVIQLFDPNALYYLRRRAIRSALYKNIHFVSRVSHRKTAEWRHLAHKYVVLIWNSTVDSWMTRNCQTTHIYANSPAQMEPRILL